MERTEVQEINPRRCVAHEHKESGVWRCAREPRNCQLIFLETCGLGEFREGMDHKVEVV